MKVVFSLDRTDLEAAIEFYVRNHLAGEGAIVSVLELNDDEAHVELEIEPLVCLNNIADESEEEQSSEEECDD